MDTNALLDLGWGRLLFGHTYRDPQPLADELCAEGKGRRDLCVYLRDPHVVLSLAPDRLFLDPSHTFRLWPDAYQPTDRDLSMIEIRPVTELADAEAVRTIYLKRGMVCGTAEFVAQLPTHGVAAYHAAYDAKGQILGTIMGVDHVKAFNDPEGGSSIWSLAVDPACQIPGVGEALVRYIIDLYFGMDRKLIDLSAIYTNVEAISLYEKIGFERVPAFCIKHKNPINERYFTPHPTDDGLNPYAKIIIDEARLRGVRVEVLDAGEGYFRLSLGGRSVDCRESLSDLTSAVAMSRCDNKRVTRRVLKSAGIRVPAQAVAVGDEEDIAFLSDHQRIVVKPARGEQGAGISVGIETADDLTAAIADARKVCEQVLLEECVQGKDVRVIVINQEVVAAAVRSPAAVIGDGTHNVRELIERYSRRREAATGGESRVPMDRETERCVAEGGYTMDSVLPENEELVVRSTANLHTGGTINDITPKLHRDVAADCIAAATELGMPLVGLDLLMPDPTGTDYVMIEANERPGLANHEPQPTAARFVEMLFPQLKRQETPKPS